MKKLSILCLMALFSFAVIGTTGCSTLGLKLVDKLGEPDEIYKSGKDLLTGNYTIIGREGTTATKDEPMSLKGDEKGWLLSEDGDRGLHLYEMKPEEAKKFIPQFNANNMQCIGVHVTDMAICAAPKGTRVQHGKINTTMETNYIVLFNDAWNSAKRK